MTMTFEQEVLTQHDFVAKHVEEQDSNTASPVRIFQDGYVDGKQQLNIYYSDGTIRIQGRVWDREEFNQFDKMRDSGDFATPAEQAEYIETHSKLETEAVVEQPKTVEEAAAQAGETSLESYLDRAGLIIMPNGTLSTTCSLEALQQMSMELSIALSAKELLTSATSKLRNMLRGFVGFSKHRNFEDIYNFQYNKIQNAAKVAKGVSYAAVAKTPLNSMRGQKKSYVEVLKALQLAQAAAETTFKDSIGSVKHWLATLVSSADIRQSVRNVSALRPNLGTGETSIYTPVRKALAACIANHPETKHPYSMLFANHSEWDDLLLETPPLLGRLTLQGPEQFNTAVASCVDLVNHLISIIDRHQDQAVSKEVAMKMGEVIYALAQEVEFCAAYNTLAIQYCNALSETAEHFLKNRK